MKRQSKLFVTIPLMDELGNIRTLLKCLSQQTYRDFKVIICVNQPENYHQLPEKQHICHANKQTLLLLNDVATPDFQIIDRSSLGNGWTGKHFGVGWARKVAMDEAALQAKDDDIIIAMDGDTEYGNNYLESIAQTFAKTPEIKALSIPYYHKLSQKPEEDMAILRYEIYMRYYALNMLRIKNPYAFTAIGSAMACTAAAYKGIRGITPHKSGEDFYFIQKLRKFGSVGIAMDELAFPEARFSDRVFFGTGPAMIKGHGGDWSGYPIYPYSFFDEVKSSFDNFGDLFEKDIEIPMSDFLIEKFNKNLWQDLRDNVKSKSNFEKACWHKVDGLRILQFVKWRGQNTMPNNEENLISFLIRFYPDEALTSTLKQKGFDFKNAGIEQLDIIRNFLFEKETQWRQKIKILR